jgi:hypothetical protein
VAPPPASHSRLRLSGRCLTAPVVRRNRLIPGIFAGLQITCLAAVKGPSVRAGPALRAWALRRRQGAIRAWARRRRQGAAKALSSSNGLTVRSRAVS